MPRKAKGDELTNEQIIEMQCLFESNLYSNIQIAKTMQENCKKNITEGTVRHYAKKGNWQRGKKETIFEAKKVVATEDVLTLFKSEKEQKEYKALSKQAEQEGEKVAIRKLQSESYKIEMENKLAEVGMKYLDKFTDALDNIKNGKVVDTEIEGVVIDENGKPANILKKTTVLRPKEFEKIVAMMQAFGILQTTPTVAIQNNNNAEAKVESKPQHITEVVNGAFAIETPENE